MTADFPDWGPAVRAGRFLLTGSGVQTVGVSHNQVALRATTPCQQVMVKARRANVGTIYLGPFGVTDDETAGTGGLQLAPGDMLSFPINDVALVYINGLAGDGVTFLWWT